MAGIEGLRGVRLAPRHVDDACVLVAEAGWNQTPDDWRLMIAAGEAIGFEDESGRLVASALDMPYGPQFGWISMVLVSTAWRRKGVATYLLDRCIENHEAAGRIPVLDATADGEKVYARLGFSGVFTIRRWQGEAVLARTEADVQVRRAGAPDAEWIVAYDRRVFAGDRAAVLRDLLTRDGAAGWIAPHGDGFLLSRKGRVARQIGPLCAESDETARRLLAAALGHLDEPVFIDVPDRHTAIIDWLQQRGFAAQRPFRRMLKGRSEGFGDLARMFAVAGPELG